MTMLPYGNAEELEAESDNAISTCCEVAQRTKVKESVPVFVLLNQADQVFAAEEDTRRDTLLGEKAAPGRHAKIPFQGE